MYAEVAFVGVLNFWLLPLDCQWLSGDYAARLHVRDLPGTSASCHRLFPCRRVRMHAGCMLLPFVGHAHVWILPVICRPVAHRLAVAATWATLVC